MVDFSFKPKKEQENQKDLVFSSLLPAYLQTRENKKLFDVTVQQLFNKESSETVAGYIGRKDGSFYNYKTDYYVNEKTKNRSNYQLEPSMVSEDTTKSIFSTLSYDDFISKLQTQGSIVNDHNRLFSQEYYSFSPCIDLDKFVNYSNYYWVATGGLTLDQQKEFYNTSIDLVNNTIYLKSYGYKKDTVVRFESYSSLADLPETAPQLVVGESYKIEPINDDLFRLKTSAGIVITFVSTGLGTFYLQPQTDFFGQVEGQQTWILSDGTKLSNGLRITPRNDVRLDINGKTYIVEGVGESILFIDDSLYGVSGAYDGSPYDTYGYSYTSSDIQTPDYVTISRGSSDNNPWSRRNRWFHKDLLSNTPNLEGLTQARRPIVEFFRNIELYNYGSYARQDVDVCYQGNIQNITGLSSLIIDGVNIEDDYRILALTDEDPERVNRIFKVYGLNSTGTISLSLETDGLDIYGHPQKTESVYVKRGTLFGGSFYNYDGKSWIKSQQKSTINQFPVFNLYDMNGIALNDVIEYPESTFSGNTLFQYETDQNRTKDPVLNLNISTNLLGKPNFVNTLENIKYSFQRDFVTTHITGYYFFKKDGQFFNHWHKSPHQSRQYIHDNFVISENKPLVPRSIKLASNTNINGFVMAAGEEGSGDYVSGVDLSTIDGDVLCSIGDLILLKDQSFAYQNGVYEYASGTRTDATLKRSPLYDTNSELEYGEAVYVTDGIVNKSHTFVMIQTTKLDWTSIPQLWDSIKETDGLQTVFNLSQEPKPLADYEVEYASVKNIDGFDVLSSTISGINLPLMFGNFYFFNGQRFIIKDQTNRTENGVYEYSSGSISSATITRILEDDLRYGSTVYVTKGTLQNTVYELTQTQLLDWYTVPVIFTQKGTPRDYIRVTLNGIELNRNTDYDISGDILRLSLSLQIKKDDYLEVVTYSDSTPNSNYSGYYGIPLNLESNPTTKFVSSVNYSDVIEHFASIIENQNNFSGMAVGVNNFRDLTVDLGLGNKILQHNAPLLRSMLLNSDENINLYGALDYINYEYSKFYSRFLNKILNLQTRGFTDQTAFKTWIDTALTEINVGKNETFPFFNNKVAGGNYYIPPSSAYLGMSGCYRPYRFVDRSSLIPLMVIRFHDGQILGAYDTTVSLSDDDHTQLINLSSSEQTYLLNYDLVYSWEISVEIDNNTLIPEVDYTVQTGSTKPKIIFKNQQYDGLIAYVRWSRDVLDNVVLFMENTIYTSISTANRQSDDFDDANQFFSVLEVRPGFFRNSGYTYAEWVNITSKEFNKWITENKVTYDLVNTVYDATNPFTWNYSSVNDPDGNKSIGCWKGIFQYFYDTFRPNTHPWEMFGFTEKPKWWTNRYGNPPYSSGNYQLWNDVKNGFIAEGTRKGFYNHLKRPDIFNYIPVDEHGDMLDPVTIGLVDHSPRIQTTTDFAENYSEYASAPFVFGDLGPIEYTWTVNPSFGYSVSKSLYLMKPAKFVEYFWNTNHLVKIFKDQADNQLVSSINDLYVRITPQQETVFSYNDEYSNIGLQQVIVEHLKSGGKTAQYLYERINGLGVYLTYRASGYVDAGSMRVVADSFGVEDLNNTQASTLIPSDNIRVVLNKNSNIGELSYSGLIVSKHGDYYTLSGYDFKNQYFDYYKPVTASLSSTVNFGGSTISVLAWQPNTVYVVGVYVLYNDKYFVCTQDHTSGNNFDEKKWKMVGSLPIVGGVSVKKYTQYEAERSVMLYNSRFFSVQELANFVYGYEKYLKTIGFSFDTVDQESGEPIDFSFMMKQILSWSLDSNVQNNTIIVSPMSDYVALSTSFGFVDDFRKKVGGFPSIVDRLGFSIPTDNLSISRVDDKLTVKPLPTNVSQRIYGLKAAISSYEHVIVLDNITNFDNLVYDSLLNIRQQRVKLFTTRSLGWNGQFKAPGFVISDSTITPNFEKSVNDFTHFFDPNNAVTATDTDLIAKKTYGFQKSNALSNLLLDDRDQFQFYLGFLREKGTSQVFERLFRSNYITNTGTVDFYEEWAVRLGRYGAITASSDIELMLDQDEIKNNPQMVRFINSSLSDPSQEYVDIQNNDGRYILKRDNNLTINQFKTSDYSSKIPTAGYALLSDALILCPYYSQLSQYVNPYIAVQPIKNGDRLWLAIDKNGIDWNMYRYDSVNTVVSITVTDEETPPVVVCSSNVSFLDNEVVIIQQTSDDNAGVYIVKNSNGTASFDLYNIDGTIPTTLKTASYSTPALLGRLHPCRFKSAARQIVSDIQNIILPANTSFTINGVNVSLLQNDTTAVIVSKINAAAIPNITAENWFGKLLIKNSSNYSDITLVPSVVKALGIRSTTPVSGWISSDLWFVDNVNGGWAVIEQNGTIIRQQQDRIDCQYLKNVCVVDSRTNVKIVDLNIFNPLQSIFPFNVEKEIDFTVDSDPAKYSSLNLYEVWSDDQIGRVWWDTSTVRYLDYDQSTSEYKQNNWGAIFPNTQIDVYEWVESPVKPEQWSNYVTNGLGYGVYSEQSTPKSLSSYTTTSKFNTEIGSTVPVYYFWIKNNSYIPPVYFRSTSIVDITNIIKHPTNSGVLWMSPIAADTFVVSNIRQFLSDVTLIRIVFYDYKTQNIKHSHWSLIHSNETIQNPPAQVWDKMKDSLVSFVKMVGTRQYIETQGVGSELLNSLQNGGYVTTNINDDGITIYSVNLPVPDPNLLQRQRYGTEFRPRQSWFKDYMTARKTFVEVINKNLLLQNWVDVSATWNKTISTDAVLDRRVDFTVATLADMNSLLITTAISNGQTVFVESDVSHGGKWSLWVFDSTTKEKFVLTQVQSFDTKDYWNTVDWYALGYNTTVNNIVDLTVETIGEWNKSEVYPNKIVKINDSGDGRWSIFIYTTEWVLIARQDGTVQFNSKLYSGTTIEEIKSSNEAMIYVIDGYYNDLSTTLDRNNTTITMIKEAFTQNSFIDWAFKTSLISSSGFDDSIRQSSIFIEDPSPNISEFLDEAKPFRSKFRGTIAKKESTQDLVGLGTTDDYHNDITMVFDSVALEPNQDVIKQILDLPQLTDAQINFRNTQIREKFTAADRIAIFSSSKPQDVMVRSQFNGFFIDGVGFKDFSLLLGIGAGYDNSPYDNLMGYDIRNSDFMALYDAFVNGVSFTETSDTTIDANKFIQPYLNENRPEQLALIRSADSLNLSVFTDGLFGSSAGGYDVYGYDYEINGSGGYDYAPEGASRQDGCPKITNDYYTSDGVQTNYEISQLPQSNNAVCVFIDGLLQTVGYSVDWSQTKVRVVFSTVPTVGAKIKIVSLSVGGGQRVKIKTVFNAISNVIDISTEIGSINGLVVTVNGELAQYTTLASGDTTLSNTEIKITSPSVTNATVNVFMFTSYDFTVVYKQSLTYNSVPLVINNPSDPQTIPYSNNFVYMDGKRLLPPIMKCFDIVQSGTTMYDFNTPLPIKSYITIYVDNTLINPSTYSINYETNQIITAFAPSIGQTVTVLIGGCQEYFISGNIIDIFSSKTGSTMLNTVPSGSSFVVDGITVTLSRPDSSNLVVGYGVIGNTIVGTIALNTTTAMSLTNKILSINGVDVPLVSTDSLEDLVVKINLLVSSVSASIITVTPTTGYLSLTNINEMLGRTIILSNMTDFGIIDGTYSSVVEQSQTTLGSTYLVSYVNKKLRITKKTGTAMTIVDTVFGLNGTVDNTGKTISVISFDDDTSLNIRTEVFYGNIFGKYPITTDKTDDNLLFVSKSGIDSLFDSDFIVDNNKQVYTDLDYMTNQLETAGKKFVVADYVSQQTQEDFVITTSVNSRPTSPTTGFRVFKNSSDSWQYMRISDENTTQLVEPLKPLDLEVVVKDSTVLTQPNKTANIPGIVFVNNERICFWEVDQSTPNAHKLQQLWRGTNGTSWGVTHIPYGEQTVSVLNSTFTFVDGFFRTNDTIKFKGVLPSPLNENDHYYIVALSKDSFKIASSLENAINGVYIDTGLFVGTVSVLFNGALVRDGGIDQNIPQKDIRWFFTPNGFNNSTDGFAKFVGL